MRRDFLTFSLLSWLRKWEDEIKLKLLTPEESERYVVEFETEEALQEWRVHPEHSKAKRRGVESFFSGYKFQICSVIRERSWTAKS